MWHGRPARKPINVRHSWNVKMSQTIATQGTHPYVEMVSETYSITQGGNDSGSKVDSNSDLGIVLGRAPGETALRFDF